MVSNKKSALCGLFIFVCILFSCTLFTNNVYAQSNAPVIRSIIIHGNNHVSEPVILHRLPYKPGDNFDLQKSPAAIANVYQLGYFSQVIIEGEEVADKKLDIHVTVEEKKLIDQVVFRGNKNMKSRIIKEKLNLDKIITVDEETLQKICRDVAKLYQEENRHAVVIEASLEVNEQCPDKATAVFDICEGPTASIARVHFVGVEKIPERKLRKMVFSRERWLCQFLDSAGTYNEEMTAMDKHRIEYFYRDHGYLTAKVTDTKICFSDDRKDITITFYINEGELYCVRSVTPPSDEIFTAKELEPLIRLEVGKPYAHQKMIDSINALKELWGEYGYIYADVYPQVQPDPNSNYVDVSFHVERGNKLFANRINITGNCVTRDKVIRRQIDICEGDLITTKKLNRSQSHVEYLSFFEPNSVGWQIHRLSNELADLEMHVKETKTGSLNLMASYGSDKYTPRPSLRGSINATKSNLFGLGYDIGGMIQGNRHHIPQKLEGHFFNPHLFDSNTSMGLTVYKRIDEYDQWRLTDPSPIQRVSGGAVRFGFAMPRIDRHLQVAVELGFEHISNNNPRATGKMAAIFDPIVRRTFQKGDLSWLGIDLVKDTRNHQVYPTEGYKLVFANKFALPQINNNFSCFKTELEGSAYNALIGYDSLVLGLHARAGTVTDLGHNTVIPYKELFHMGGQTTVRGFVWGGIGPALAFTDDPLGGRHALQFNMELIFPLVPEQKMKAHVFYDAGAGWDTPKGDISNHALIKRDSFDFRHAVGFGLNLTQPMPAKIDWGFKLDRRKKENESAHEFHLSMNYAW